MGVRRSLPLIACSLDGAGQRARLAEWEELLVLAASRGEISDGARYTFPAVDGMEERVRSLAQAEQECCSFFDFGVTVVGDHVEMTVVAPADGQAALRYLFSP